MSNSKQAQANKEKQKANASQIEDGTKTLDQLDSEQKDILFAAMERCNINPDQFFGVQSDSSRKN